MDGAQTTSSWMQTIVVTRLDPRHAQEAILAPTSDTTRILQNLLTVLNEVHRPLNDDDELDAATATPNMYEPSDDDEDEDEEDDYGENDIIEEEEEAGAMVDYGDAYRDGGFGGVPASAAAVDDRIKKRKYHEMETGGDDEGGGAHRTRAAARCMICIEDFEAGDDLGVMPCSHRFHQGCLVKWMARSRLCPCCLYALSSEAQTRP